jgi:hypothetical protein
MGTNCFRRTAGCLAVLLCSGAAWTAAQFLEKVKPIKAEIRNEDGRFQLYRGGRPYLIKGAVWVGEQDGKVSLKDLAERGANSIRAGANTRTLDEAQRLGLSVLVNLPMRMESVHKFDYSDEKAVRDQFEKMKERVMQVKDHPAVLMYAIGNELSVGYKNRQVWNAVNDVARMIHEVDPNHPAMTVIGDGSINSGDIQEIMKRAPDLDLLGVNYYKGVEAVPAKIRQNEWNKPYVLTEWGPSGDWQVPRTAWKASIEETSTEKAQRYMERYQSTVVKDSERCLGSYAFIWAWRQERTHTWYGMFLESGERTEAVNTMQYLWTGRWPENRAPRVEDLRIDGQAAADNVYLKPGSTHRAALKVEDPESDSLTYRWEVMLEVAPGGYAGLGEVRSKPMTELIQKAAGREVTFAAPEKEGAYRVFVFVLDGRGNAATANIPFFVRP